MLDCLSACLLWGGDSLVVGESESGDMVDKVAEDGEVDDDDDDDDEGK